MNSRAAACAFVAPSAMSSATSISRDSGPSDGLGDRRPLAHLTVGPRGRSRRVRHASGPARLDGRRRIGRCPLPGGHRLRHDHGRPAKAREGTSGWIATLRQPHPGVAARSLPARHMAIGASDSRAQAMPTRSPRSRFSSMHRRPGCSASSSSPRRRLKTARTWRSEARSHVSPSSSLNEMPFWARTAQGTRRRSCAVGLRAFPWRSPCWPGWRGGRDEPT